MLRASQSIFFREIIFSEHVDVTPRYRRVDYDQLQWTFFGSNFRCILDLSGEVEIIPVNDAESCGGFGTFMQIDPIFSSRYSFCRFFGCDRLARVGSALCLDDIGLSISCGSRRIF